MLLLVLTTFSLPLLTGVGGEAFRTKQDVLARADGAYDDLALDLATATAFNDARRQVNRKNMDEITNVFYSNLQTLTAGDHWGNVGLFVGPKGTSENSDVWSIFFGKVRISAEQIAAYDAKTNEAFTKYMTFGAAVQKLNMLAQKAKGAGASMDAGLDQMSATGAQIANLGITLVDDYNPSPVILALFDASELNNHPNNRLIQFVNSVDQLADIIRFFGTRTSFGVSMSFLLLGLLVVILILTGALMTLINGRTAGENMRKALVKIVIGCVGIPLLAKGFDSGVSFLKAATTAEIEAPDDRYVSQNLNFADWYSCGFAIPDGVQIVINKYGEFSMGPDAVRKINEYTYERVHGEKPTPEAMKDLMERYQADAEDIEMGVGFSEATTEQKVKIPLLGEVTLHSAWDTESFYQILDNFGDNAPLFDGTDVGDIESVGYLGENGIQMSYNESEKIWNLSGASSASGNVYGLSPIAATNLMRTTFTGSSMIVNNFSTMGSVTLDVDAGGASGTMGSISKFIAMFTMVVAAVKGLFTIFTAGFAGIIGGGVKSVGGSSAGFGQAIGGILAVIGGVFGISILMTITFQLLNAVYGVIAELISGTDVVEEMLRPIKSNVRKIPILGPTLANAMKSAAQFIMTIITSLTVPKFGGIPITLFCSALADLPNRFSERAQQIENKITGDFRAGGGHSAIGSQASQLAGAAAHSAKMGIAAMGAGVGMAAGAIGGYALNKAGSALEGHLNKTGGGSLSDEETPTNPTPEDPAALAGAGMEPEGGTEPEKKDGPDTGKSEGGMEPEKKEGSGAGKPESGGSTINQTETYGSGMKEEAKEVTNENTEGGSVSEHIAGDEVHDSDHLSDQETAMEEATLNENAAEEVISSDVIGETISSSDQAVVSDQVSSEATMNNSEASATVFAGEDGPRTGVPESGDSMSQGLSGGGTAAPDAGAASSMGGASEGTSEEPPDKKQEAKDQKRARRAMAIAKGLQTAGNHTTGKQALAGVAAGTLHAMGGYTGTQALTQKGMDAVHASRNRAAAVRAGAPQAAMPEEKPKKKKPVTGGGGPKPPSGGGGQAAPRETARRSRLIAESLAREAERRR